MLEGDRVEGPCELISEREVEEAIRDMKAGKAGGPSEVVGEMLKAAGRKGVRMMAELCNQVVREGKIPSEWELSTLIPIYKGKGCFVFEITVLRLNKNNTTTVYHFCHDTAKATI